jgi:hypothetical protein
MALEEEGVMARRRKNILAIDMVVEGGRLVPFSPYDAELLDRYRKGARLKVEAWEDRSLPFQKRYWALLKAVVDATGRWANSEALHEALLHYLDMVEEIPGIDGKMVRVRRSTSFDAMDQTTFQEYERVAEMIICTEILPGMSADDLFALAENRIRPYPTLPPDPDEVAA